MSYRVSIIDVDLFWKDKPKKNVQVLGKCFCVEILEPLWLLQVGVAVVVHWGYTGATILYSVCQ